MDEQTLTQPVVPSPTPRRKRNRTLFWPGFAAGFLLLSLLSCGGLAMTMGLDRFNLTNLQEGDSMWTPQPATPTVEGAQAAEPDRENLVARAVLLSPSR